MFMTLNNNMSSLEKMMAYLYRVNTPKDFCSHLDQMLSQGFTSLLKSPQLVAEARKKQSEKRTNYGQWKRLVCVLNNLVADDDRSQIIQAIQNGDGDLLNACLNETLQMLPSLTVDTLLFKGKSLLHLAIEQKKRSIVVQLLDRGASLKKLVNNKTPLSAAVKCLMDDVVSSHPYQPSLLIIWHLVIALECQDTVLSKNEFDNLMRVLYISNEESDSLLERLQSMLLYHLQFNRPPIYNLITVKQRLNKVRNHRYIIANKQAESDDDGLNLTTSPQDGLFNGIGHSVRWNDVQMLRKYLDRVNQTFDVGSKALSGIIEVEHQANLLHLAAYFGRFSAAALLKQYGQIDLNVCDRYGDTPCDKTLQLDHPMTLKVLLTYPELETNVLKYNDDLMASVKAQADICASKHQKQWQQIQGWFESYNLTHHQQCLCQAASNNHMSSFKTRLRNILSLLDDPTQFAQLYVNNDVPLIHRLTQLAPSQMIHVLNAYGVSFYCDDPLYGTTLDAAIAGGRHDAIRGLLFCAPDLLTWHQETELSVIAKAVDRDCPDVVLTLVGCRMKQIWENESNCNTGKYPVKLQGYYERCVEFLEKAVAIAVNHFELEGDLDNCSMWQDSIKTLEKYLEKYQLLFDMAVQRKVPFNKLDQWLFVYQYSASEFRDGASNNLLHLGGYIGVPKNDIEKLIIDYHLNPVSGKDDQYMPLMIAAKNGHWGCVETMMNVSPDEGVNNMGFCRNKLVHIAAVQGNRTMVAYINKQSKTEGYTNINCQQYCTLFKSDEKNNNSDTKLTSANKLVSNIGVGAKPDYAESQQQEQPLISPVPLGKHARFEVEQDGDYEIFGDAYTKAARLN